jgi:excisionase family DNA binding protein
MIKYEEVAMSEDLLPIEEAARVLGVSKPTLYRLVSQGAVRGLRAGKQWRFRRDDLRAYLEQEPPPAPVAPTGLVEAEIAFFADNINAGERADAKSKPGADVSDGQTDAGALFDLLTENAIAAGASDIHLDPMPDGLRLRVRIDGVLHILRQFPAALREPLTAAIKERAQMNPAERRLPQDGRIPYRVGGKEFELRVSCVPTLDGEATVARILDRSDVLIGLDRLGLASEDQARLEEWMGRPNGLIVVTGLVGSGRSTLLYSLLTGANAPEKKLLTVEDPVELRLEGAAQIPVGKRAGLTYAQGLRVLMRQDPDIIYVADVPDSDTARLLHEAALTGHLTLSALPATRAAEVPGWMTDRGVEPFVVASTLIGVVAVRLLRKVCTQCRESLQIPSNDPAFSRLRLLSAEGGFTIAPDATIYYGRGCAACRGTGFKGRTGLFEIMPFSKELADAVLRGAAPEELEAIAVEAGMKTLLADGMRKVTDGVTTYGEVMRVVTAVF